MLDFWERRSRRALIALTAAAALALATAPGAPAAQAADATPGQATSITAHTAAPGKKLLPRQLHGRAALKALDAAGKRAAAAENGTTVAALTELVEHDDTVWLGPTGRIFYADTATAQDVQTAAVAAAAPGWAVQPNAQAFQLHSLPGSKHTIYLDFDGYTLPSGTGWSPDISAGTYGGFTTDGSAAFTDAELTYVQTVWRIIAEKYAPFDIDVTTEAPAAGALDYTGGGDLTWGTRVVISSDMGSRGTACPASSSGGCLGIAYVDVFNALEPSVGYYEPAWVWTKFTAATPTLSAGQVANAAAHEAGHTLGLGHDATNADPSYYAGSGNWFPIMGSGVLAVGQFSKGDYPDAWTDPGQGSKDDLAVIASNGAPQRTDDYGGTTAGAQVLGQQASYTVDGFIGSRTDLDVFKITTGCQDDVVATVQGIGDGQAVDLKVSILDSLGSVLAGDDPTSGQDTGSPWPYTPTGLDASATQSAAAAPAGTYYVSVDGVGKGTFATGGYDDYGSIGRYRLTIQGCAGTPTTAPSAPTSLATVPNTRTTTGSVSWNAPASPGTSPVTSYTVSGVPGGPYVVNAPTTSKALTGLVPGTTYTVSVTASSNDGTSPAATKTLRVPTWAPTGKPTLTVTTHTSSFDVTWTAPPNPGQAVANGWHLKLYDASHTQVFSSPEPVGAIGTTISGAPPGSYTVEVYQDVISDDGLTSGTAAKAFTIGKVPSAPKIGTASSGASGGAVNALARWGAPTTTGGAPITGYRVYAYRVSSSGAVISTKYSTMRSPSSRSYSFPLAAGRYKFRVVAYNAVGKSPYSSYSAVVTAR